jgi:hypothetical protein
VLEFDLFTIYFHLLFFFPSIFYRTHIFFYHLSQKNAYQGVSQAFYLLQDKLNISNWGPNQLVFTLFQCLQNVQQARMLAGHHAHTMPSMAYLSISYYATHFSPFKSFPKIFDEGIPD